MDRFYQDMARRLPDLDTDTLHPERGHDGITVLDDNISIRTVQSIQSTYQAAISGYFEFEKELLISRAYRKIAFNDPTSAMSLDEAYTTAGWSCLSGLSLAEVSCVSVMNLVVTPSELHNPGHYRLEPNIPESVGIDIRIDRVRGDGFLDYYLHMRIFLSDAAYVRKFPRSEKAYAASEKIKRLSKFQMSELTNDAHDELMRRRSLVKSSFLPAEDHFHPKRNQARMKLSTLHLQRFCSLIRDITFEIERRYPVSTEFGDLEPNAETGFGNTPVAITTSWI